MSESRRSATQRDAGRALDGRADEVHRARRRGGEHCVDALALDDPDRRRDRGQVPGHVLVGDEQPPSEQPRLDAGPLEALLAVQLLGRAAARAARRSAPGGSTPASAARARRRGAPTSGRPERARASRSRARAGASPSSACAGRHRLLPAGSTSRRAGPSRVETVEHVPAGRSRPAGDPDGASSGSGRRPATWRRSGAGSPGCRCGRTAGRRRAARTAGSPSCRRRGPAGRSRRRRVRRRRSRSWSRRRRTPPPSRARGRAAPARAPGSGRGRRSGARPSA